MAGGGAPFAETFTKEAPSGGSGGYDDSAALYFAGCLLACAAVGWAWYLFSRIRRRLLAAAAPARGCRCGLCATPAAGETAGRGSRSPLLAELTSLPFALNSLGFAAVSAALAIVVKYLQSVETVQSFDPYEILEVTRRSTAAEIRRAFRNLSLKFHPDRNRGSAAAASRYILLTKAYQALTDATGRRNFERYGNPDGPGPVKIGIGLPQFLLKQEYQLLFLVCFILVVLVLVPLIFTALTRRNDELTETGVQHATAQTIGEALRQQSRQRHVLELVAASREAAAAAGAAKPFDWDDEPAVRDLARALKREIPGAASFYDSSGKKAASRPDAPAADIVKLLLLAHANRRPDLVPAPLRPALRRTLLAALPISNTMVEVAAYQDWYATVLNVLDARKALLHAIPPGTLSEPELSLAQLPHASLDRMRRKLPQKVRMQCRSLLDLVTADSGVREMVLGAVYDTDEKGGAGSGSRGNRHETVSSADAVAAPAEPLRAPSTAEYMRDASAFLSDLVLFDKLESASLTVEDEPRICVDDVPTLRVELGARASAAALAMAPSFVHAPLFPRREIRHAWYFLLADQDRGRLLHLEKFGLDDLREKFAEQGKNDQAVLQAVLEPFTAPGRYNLRAELVNANFFGLDLGVNFAVKVCKRSESGDQVHPKDRALDEHPSLVQQLFDRR